jgi:hypothetical protein
MNEKLISVEDYSMNFNLHGKSRYNAKKNECLKGFTSKPLVLGIC